MAEVHGGALRQGRGQEITHGAQHPRSAAHRPPAPGWGDVTMFVRTAVAVGVVGASPRRRAPLGAETR